MGKKNKGKKRAVSIEQLTLTDHAIRLAVDRALTEMSNAWAEHVEGLETRLDEVSVRVDAQADEVATNVLVAVRNAITDSYKMLDLSDRIGRLSDTVDQLDGILAEAIERIAQLEAKQANFVNNLTGAGLADLGRRLEALEAHVISRGLVERIDAVAKRVSKLETQPISRIGVLTDEDVAAVPTITEWSKIHNPSSVEHSNPNCRGFRSVNLDQGDAMITCDCMQGPYYEDWVATSLRDPTDDDGTTPEWVPEGQQGSGEG